MKKAISGLHVLATAGLLSLALASCKPPPTDDEVNRAQVEQAATGPSEPIDSPNTENAIWANGIREGRIIYGEPGEAPLMSIECVRTESAPQLLITRHAAADEGAQAFMALIGNGHVARVPVDATLVDGQSVWQGTFDPRDPKIEVLTGRRSLTATVPGAGIVRLNSSARPMALVEACRAERAP